MTYNDFSHACCPHSKVGTVTLCGHNFMTNFRRSDLSRRFPGVHKFATLFNLMHPVWQVYYQGPTPCSYQYNIFLTPDWWIWEGVCQGWL